MKTKSRRKLKQVIVVRHGQYSDATMALDDSGIKQIEALMERLKAIIKPKHVVVILSSERLRAKQSAEIIAKQFNVQNEICGALRLDGFECGEIQATELFERGNGADVVIAITHFEAPSGIVNALSRKFFEREVSKCESENGGGFILCLKTGEVKEI